MQFGWIKKLLATALLAVTPAIAYAQSAETLTQNWFYAETQTARASQFDALKTSAKTDNAAKFGLGTVQFFSAIEGFSQDMLKYGLASHDNELRTMLPLPLPQNPNPATLTYDGLRQTITNFETDLEQALSTLASVNPDEPVGISINFENARFNLTGQESIPNELRFADLIIGAQSMNPGASAATAEQELTFRFDNADAIWLETNSDLKAATRLYEKCGFVHLKEGELWPTPYARCNLQMVLEL